MMFLKCKTILAALLLMSAMLLGTSTTALAAEEGAGKFDEITGNEISGWAWDSSSPNTAVPLTVTITRQSDSQTVKRIHTTAAIHRSDLDSEFGNGNHGFRLTINWDELEDGTYNIRGWVDEKELTPATYTKGSQETHTQRSSNITSLGTFRVTGYCPCHQCSEGWGRHTSTGTIAKSSHTIAVDPRVIPYGSKVMINGTVYTAEDRGGGVRGNHIDIFFDTHAQTRMQGNQMQEVFLITG